MQPGEIACRRTNTLLTFHCGWQCDPVWLSWLTHGQRDDPRVYGSASPALRKHKSFPSVVCRVAETGATVNLFAKGKGVVSGLPSDFLALLSAEWIVHLMNARPPADQTRPAEVRVVATRSDAYAIDLGTRIDTRRLYEEHKAVAVITRHFESVRLRHAEPKFTVIAFASGKLNVIGCRTRDALPHVLAEARRIRDTYRAP